MGNKETRNDYGTEILRDALIMIVHDQEANIRLPEVILGAAGYTRLVSTTDSRDVLSLMGTSPPDLILLDLTMPKMDGFEVIEQLNPQIPVEDYLPIRITELIRRR
jgi:CheY-like chemotaxis protein